MFKIEELIKNTDETKQKEQPQDAKEKLLSLAEETLEKIDNLQDAMDFIEILKDLISAKTLVLAL